MAKVPHGAIGVNNFAKSEPRSNVSSQSKNLGAPIKSTVMPAAATHAGHGQVNPGSSKGNTSIPALNYGLATEGIGKSATQAGPKMAGGKK